MTETTEGAAQVEGAPSSRKEVHKGPGYPLSLWEPIVLDYRMGKPYNQLAREYKPTRVAIKRYMERNGITRDLVHLKGELSHKAASAVDDADSPEALTDGDLQQAEAVVTGVPIEVVEEIPGQAGKDAAEPEPTPEPAESPPQVTGSATQFLAEVAKEAALLSDHRKQARTARAIVSEALRKLEAVMLRGKAEDVITIQTKAGELVQLPFLGQRESPADAIVKLATAMQKLHAIERTAHNMKTTSDDTPAAGAGAISVSVNLPGKEIHIEGPRAKPAPTPIEGECETIGETVAHLGALE